MMRSKNRSTAIVDAWLASGVMENTALSSAQIYNMAMLAENAIDQRKICRGAVVKKPQRLTLLQACTMQSVLELTPRAYGNDVLRHLRFRLDRELDTGSFHGNLRRLVQRGLLNKSKCCMFTNNEVNRNVVLYSATEQGVALLNECLNEAAVMSQEK